MDIRQHDKSVFYKYLRRLERFDRIGQKVTGIGGYLELDPGFASRCAGKPRKPHGLVCVPCPRSVRQKQVFARVYRAQNAVMRDLPVHTPQRDRDDFRSGGFNSFHHDLGRGKLPGTHEKPRTKSASGNYQWFVHLILSFVHGQASQGRQAACFCDSKGKLYFPECRRQRPESKRLREKAATRLRMAVWKWGANTENTCHDKSPGSQTERSTDSMSPQTSKRPLPELGNGLMENKWVLFPSHFPTLALPRSGFKGFFSVRSLRPDVGFSIFRGTGYGGKGSCQCSNSYAKYNIRYHLASSPACFDTRVFKMQCHAQRVETLCG